MNQQALDEEDHQEEAAETDETEEQFCKYNILEKEPHYRGSFFL